MTLIQLPGITLPVDLSAPMYVNSHFTWGEFTRDGERMPANTVFGGITIPAAQIVANGLKIARELDKIRSQFGDRPIAVTSWLRPPAINRAVGGVPESQHIIGWAADIQIDGYEPHDVAARLSPTWAGGLGDSISFTHLDLRQLMGHASARWDYGFA
jgi:hypothetical protein